MTVTLTSEQEQRLARAAQGRGLDSRTLLAQALDDVLARLESADVRPAEAARMLNVSRPYLVRLLDEGRLPSRVVGTQRRVRLADLLDFRARQDAESEAALSALTAQAQELGLGY